MGKTTLAGLLAVSGFPVLEADALARELTAPSGEALPEIVRVFGTSVLDSEGGLDRRRVAAIIFGNANKRKQLERILHPRIRLLWKRRAAPFRFRQAVPIFIVIPLLYETSAENEFDSVVCVACRAEEQGSRLKARGWSGEHIQQRLRAQWDVERKMSLADLVIWTSCPFEMTMRQAECLAERFGRPAESRGFERNPQARR